MSNDPAAYYNDHVEYEWKRLLSPACAIEFASTLRLIRNYFPATGSVADIGCGPGRYAIELARRGYRVTLIEPAEKEIEFARRQFANHRLRGEAFVIGDARNLGMMADESFDAALLLGPQYHIIDRAGRLKSLAELRRVLKDGGVAVISYINSWGVIRTGVADLTQRYRDPGFLRSMLGELSFPEMEGFTACHWSTPPAARREIEDAGFGVLTYGSAEGAGGGMWPLIEKLASADKAAFRNFVEFASETCELPQFRDMGDHLVFVARK